MRRFQAKQDTKIKLKEVDSSQLKKGELFDVEKDTIIETDDYIKQAIDGKHLLITQVSRIFGDHWEEIKPELRVFILASSISPYQSNRQGFLKLFQGFYLSLQNSFLLAYLP
ncbi:hypothetical protein VB715_11910 [Crocosphaera sp. UHCC 0190]|uniref:hypothetical protein n=1 Tax=Crocosphaera sp. UHCC 0190 TaxID=3110246 RepID=UPI002B21BA1C|nr:hypothetical protein [Crocosphaera sp. UHCC 0190]MEA5510471.1 hypothetical protein [Crocosphaera sp. UHCC 0190]